MDVKVKSLSTQICLCKEELWQMTYGPVMLALGQKPGITLNERHVKFFLGAKTVEEGPRWMRSYSDQFHDTGYFAKYANGLLLLKITPHFGQRPLIMRLSYRSTKYYCIKTDPDFNFYEVVGKFSVTSKDGVDELYERFAKTARRLGISK